MQINEITEKIIGAAIEVHKVLGPGLLESVYEECLCRELSLRSLRFERQKPAPIEYKGVRLDCGYRLDILVEGCVVVEVKAVAAVQPVHEAQLLTHMSLADLKIGLLINFNVCVLKDGIQRMIL
jgi:GxxExxY protein